MMHSQKNIKIKFILSLSKMVCNARASWSDITLPGVL